MAWRIDVYTLVWNIFRELKLGNNGGDTLCRYAIDIVFKIIFVQCGNVQKNLLEKEVIALYILKPLAPS